MPPGFVWRAENELLKKNKIEAYGQNFLKNMTIYILICFILDYKEIKPVNPKGNQSMKISNCTYTLPLMR